MEPQPRRPPKRKDDRVILQFDYDCFYAQVFENKHPHLKSKALGIKQKNILATCNYNARAKGVRKLMLITEARKLCPELVIVEGEDLTPFRDMSKTLFQFLKSHSWNGKAERLGFDEVFLDVTDIVDYNISCLNKNALANSFFFLSKKDPELGFPCDLTSIAGPVIGDTTQHGLLENRTYLRLLVASHLAMYLRNKLETDYGYTSTCGIGTNKVLSKLAGSVHKPRNQTTLLLLTDLEVTNFMDPHALRKVPGIGFKMAHLLDSHITMVQNESDSHSFESDVTVGDARLHSDITPSFLETLLAGPGAEKGVGARVWGLLHGVDYSEVKSVSDVPSQISIEDTYKGLETVPDITAELFKLSCSLIRRMRVDLLVEDVHAEEAGAQRWAARPRTLRLAIRWWSADGSRQHQDFSRISKSGPLNPFVFDIKADIEELAQRLVSESLLPMLRRIHAEQNRKWNLQLINICVANMVAGAADDKNGSGRDISVMFRKQDEVLRPWKVVDETPDEIGSHHSKELDLDDDDDDDDELLDEMNDDESWHDAVGDSCPICGHVIPTFAKSAHARFHETDG